MAIDLEKQPNPQMNLSGSDRVTEEPELLSVRERLEERFKQSYVSRLCEYLTGMPLERPEVFDELRQDHQLIRQQYDLPDKDVVLNNLAWYEDRLRQTAEENGVEIVGLSNFEFPKNITPPKAVFDPEAKQIGIDIDKSEPDLYATSIRILEHEVIHLLQRTREPLMPIEVMEYEAHVAGLDIDDFDDVEAMQDMFRRRVYRSIISYYQTQIAHTKEKIVPEWYSVEYFIHNVDEIEVEDLSEEDRQLFHYLKENPNVLKTET